MSETASEATQAPVGLLIDRALQREWRAKYTSKELKEAAKSGAAMSDESYPIKDEDDLKKAIRAVGRGNADHDSIRKHIIARAKALGLSKLIPDSWNSDGSLKEENSVWSTTEERETFNDRRQLVESAIADSLPEPKKGEYTYGPYVMDMDETMAVYEYQGDLWEVDYTISGEDEVKLEDPVKVRRVTSYEKLARRDRERRAVENSTEDMEECPTCEGTGKIKGESTECPDCGGTGEIEKNSRNAEKEFELRRQRVENLRDSKAHEQRHFAVSDCELRDANADDDDDNLMYFEGYASLTEVPYEVAGFEETIQRGAFRRTLKESPDVVFKVDHDGLPLARTERPHSNLPGTLQLEETSRGLLVKATFDKEDQDAQQLKLKMERGLIDEMSFAFRCTDDDWDSALTKRTVKAVSLHGGDVSAVTYGASPMTGGTTSIRSDDGAVAIEIRTGKAISKARQEQIKATADKLAEAKDELDALLPAEPEPDPVTLWEGLERKAAGMSPELLKRLAGVREAFEAEHTEDAPAGDDGDEPAEGDEPEAEPQRAAVPDLTTRAAQELELLTLRGAR
jgi:HK97 family phage prohead protease